MALDCNEIIPSISEPTILPIKKCNPQEDSSLENKNNNKNKNSKMHLLEMEEDLPPWSQLEQVKKEANEVDMQVQKSPPPPQQKQQQQQQQQQQRQREDPMAIITVISGSDVVTEQVPNHNPNPTDNPLFFSKESSIVEDDDDDDDDKNANGGSQAEYTSFAKAPSRFVFYKIPKPQKNFNQFLEMSSMTVNSAEHAKTMETTTPNQHSSTISTNSDTAQAKPTTLSSLWPLRPTTDAPSGILLVFDRMLDCIDPKDDRRCLPAESPSDEEESSTWSVSRSLLLEAFEEDLSLSGSIATDESSLFRFQTSANFKAGADWLDESLDCVFPCWREDVVAQVVMEKPPLRPTPQELAQALEACRKRKWKGRELEENDENGGEDKLDGKELPTSESPPIDNPHNLDDDDDDDDPFDFPVPDFPPPVWKKPEADNESGSSLSELFGGLVYGTPSDEKDDRELLGFLDRTSATEETSTLSYSDGGTL